jgi:hypothetical protein
MGRRITSVGELARRPPLSPEERRRRARDRKRRERASKKARSAGASEAPP